MIIMLKNITILIFIKFAFNLLIRLLHYRCDFVNYCNLIILVSVIVMDTYLKTIFNIYFFKKMFSA